MQATLKNKTIFTKDNLEVLRGINSQTIDLIYLDPPFNTKRNHTAPSGSSAEGASFSDIFKEEDVKVDWIGLIAEKHPPLANFLHSIGKLGHKSNQAYLCYMAVRLIEMHRVLKDTGSIYLHCDQTMSHYLKILMDAIFGEKNFRNELIWKRIFGAGKGSQHKEQKFGTNTDSIFFYSKAKDFLFSSKKALNKQETDAKFNLVDAQGDRYYNDSAHLFRSPGQGPRPNLCYEWRGFKNKHGAGWRMTKEKLEQEYQKGNIVITGKKLERRKYLRDFKGGIAMHNLWDDIPPSAGNEKLGYPTQKPLALLERIIKASSQVGDVVLDPFCGCATSCVAAEKLGRQWVGVDVSERTSKLVQMRLEKEVHLVSGDTEKLALKGRAIRRTDSPSRTDIDHTPLTSKIRRETKHLLYGKQEGVCKGCEAHFEYRHLEIDHIVPQAKGGGDETGNLQLLCSNCNRRKGAGSMAELLHKVRTGT